MEKKLIFKILNIEEIRTQGINWERYLQDKTGKYTKSYSELTKKMIKLKITNRDRNKTGSITMVKTIINEINYFIPILLTSFKMCKYNQYW